MRKKLIIYTQFIYLLIILCSIYSCSETESEDLIDTSLFYGKWYNREKCVTDNFKIYGENNEYKHRFSLNENCNVRTFDIKELSNTYNLKGNEITYGNNENTKVIIDGTNDTSISDQIDFEFYIERIIEINEERMTIEVESKVSGRTNKRITYLYKNPN